MALLTVPSPGGRWVAVVGPEGRVTLQDAATGRTRALAVSCGDHDVFSGGGTTSREQWTADARHLRFSEDGAALLILHQHTSDWEYYYGGGHTDLRARVWLVPLDGGEPRCIHGVVGSVEHYSSGRLPAHPVSAAGTRDRVTITLSSGEAVVWEESPGR